ncbi:NmrA family NAD(P)-binding protein [Micromonospora sp. NBC_01813]|uniref:NmrA family NAD(P)-binding protein n=1 Tax=Micromonospora sp. NBC_01813 TaxID=2975988 RepID=UPI002DDB65B9|nr:NAD(P)H-binding protein [Micromonospora sp. NBC_01813]WSA08149.1 NAD(P)H-binding protein [Micromonospora sp. NBC_01813]
MSDLQPVLVTGATGKTGRRIVDALIARHHPVRAASRQRPTEQRATEQRPTDPDAAARHVLFDWHDPATHRAAVDGVHAIYLIPPPGTTDPAAQLEPFLDLAHDAGVRRIVLLSSSAFQAGDPGFGQVHATIAKQFPQWAVLRPSWFLQNFVGEHPHAHSIRRDGEIVTATAAGKVAFIDVADIAAVAVRALTDLTPHNTEHLLTGPQAHSYAEVAAMISEVSGRPVRHTAIGVDEMSRRLAGFGIPDAFAAVLAGLDGDIAAGSEDRTTSTVHDVTGRAPTSLRDFGLTHAAHWRPTVSSMS